jgi:hypothetical protein
MTKSESSSLPTRASKSLCAEAVSGPLQPSATNSALATTAILNTLATLVTLLMFRRIRISLASACILTAFSYGGFALRFAEKV